MEYQHVKKGIFRARPNRFVAQVEIDGELTGWIQEAAAFSAAKR